MTNDHLKNCFKNPTFLLTFLLLVFFIKSLFFTALFPIFEQPDEYIHYATTQYYAEPKEKKWPIYKDTKTDDSRDFTTYQFSEEIIETVKKTEFEKVRTHQLNLQPFTANTHDGKNETTIKEAHWKRYIDTYPPTISSDAPLYYKSLSFIEKMLHQTNIFTRFYTMRIFSALLGMAIILLIYLIARKINFSEKNALLIATIVAFQPFFSRFSAVVNPDILLFFAFTLYTYGIVSLIKESFSWKNNFIIFAGILIGIFAKGPGLVLLLTSFPLYGYAVYKKINCSVTKFCIISLITFLTIAICTITLIPKDYFNKIIVTNSTSKFKSQFESISEYTKKTIDVDEIEKTVRSYWDITTNHLLITITLIELLSLIGVISYLIKKETANFLPHKKYILFFILLAISLQLAIRFYDWRMFDMYGQIVIGQSGRYFMPTIAGHFLLLATGLGFLLRKEKYFTFGLKLLLIFVIFLNFYSIFNIIIPRHYL